MEKCMECMVLYSMQYKSKVIVKKVTQTVYVVVQKYACSQESNTKEFNPTNKDFFQFFKVQDPWSLSLEYPKQGLNIGSPPLLPI